MPRSDAMDARRAKIVQDAILQMRATGQELGPEFLTRLRVLVRDFDLSPLDPAPQPSLDGREPVDRKKNLLIVMKFLQLKKHDKEFQSQVWALLSESQTH